MKWFRFSAAMALVLVMLSNVHALAWEIPAHTSVPFSFVENANSKELAPHEHVPITVTQDVYVQQPDGESVLLFKEGETGYARIASIRKPAHFGAPGAIWIESVYITDRFHNEHKLRFEHDRSAKRSPFMTVIPLPAIPIAWAIKGKNVQLFDNPEQNHFVAHFVWDSTFSEHNEPAYNPPKTARNDQLDGQLDDVMSTVMTKVRKSWKPPRNKQTHSGSIVFTLTSDGQATDIEIQSSSGNPTFDQSMIEAVQRSTPFTDAMNYIQQHSMEHLTVFQNFDYSVHRRYR